jgi:hypothetical protein
VIIQRLFHRKYLLPCVLLTMVILLLVSIEIQSSSLRKTQDVLTLTRVDLMNEQDVLNQTKTQLAASQDNLDHTRRSLAVSENELATARANLNQISLDLAAAGAQLKSASAKLSASLPAPYTVMSGRRITWAWIDTNGSLNKWSMPIDTYRSWIAKPTNDEFLTLSKNRQAFSVIDYRPFMVSEVWSDVVPDYAKRCPDGLSFAREMFNLVTQLDTYSTEDAPHWPVETFTEGGGDCKNLSILFASLLKASPFPYKLQLVYMDSDHPEDPVAVNHVFIGVTSSGATVSVDCTSKTGWGSWTKFNGWMFDIS